MTASLFVHIRYTPVSLMAHIQVVRIIYYTTVIILLFYPSTDVQSPLEKQQYWLQRLQSKPPCSSTGFTPSTKIGSVYFVLDPQHTILKTSRSSRPEQRRRGLRISICPTKCTPTLDQYWLFFILATWIPFKARLPILCGWLNANKVQVPEDIFSSTHRNNLFPVWNVSLY